VASLNDQGQQVVAELASALVAIVLQLNREQFLNGESITFNVPVADPPSTLALTLQLDTKLRMMPRIILPGS
jgi:hypothetical protein